MTRSGRALGFINTQHAIEQQHIAEAAYFKAEKRGFEPGFELQDWVDAETEILSDMPGSDDLSRQQSMGAD